MIQLIMCLFGKHKYIPSYHQRWTEHKKGTRRRHIRNRFECQCCHKKTKWLNQKDTDVFLDEKASWS